jgi:hypothetical protein
MNDQLKAAYHKRAQAQSKLNAATQALDRAERFASAAQGKVAQLERTALASETEHARVLEAAILAGGPTEVISVNDAHFPALASARVQASIAAKAMTSLATAHNEARTELAAAVAQVATTVDEYLAHEGEELAVELASELEALLRKADRLREYYQPNQLHVPINSLARTPSASVLGTLDRLKPAVDDLRMPVSAKWSPTHDRLATRRAALIAGAEAGMN